MRLPILSTLTLIPILSTLGCGPNPVTAIGEQHKLRYSLHTDTSMDTRLDAARILTRNEQRIDAHFIWPAGWLAGQDAEFSHDIVGDCDVDLFNESDDHRIPTLLVTAFGPGSCTLETRRKDSPYDSIDLLFSDIDTIDPVLKTRTEEDASYQEVDTLPDTLPVGSWVDFAPIPLDADGNVLAGVHDIRLDVEPPDGIEGNLVNLMLGLGCELDTPGDYTFWLSDENSGVSTSVHVTAVE